MKSITPTIFLALGLPLAACGSEAETESAASPPATVQTAEAIEAQQEAAEDELEAAAEAAEQQGEDLAEAQGFGPVDQQIQGEIAERRAELAGAVGEDPSEQSVDGRTTAQRLNDSEDEVDAIEEAALERVEDVPEPTN